MSENGNGAAPLALHITLRDLIDGEPALRQIMTQPLPAALSMSLALVMEKAQPYLRASERPRNDLLAKYGIDQGGGAYLIPPDKQDAYKAENDQVLDRVVTLQDCGRIKLSALQALTLTGQQLYALRWLIKNDLELAFVGEN